MDRRSARRIIGAAATLGLLAQAWFFQIAAGINVVLLVISVLAAALTLRRRGARLDRFDLWIPFAAVAFAAFVAVRSDPVLATFDMLVAGILTPAAVAAIGGAALTRRSFLGIVRIAGAVAGFAVLGAREPLGAARPAGGMTRLRDRIRTALPVLRGLLVAVPVVLIFVALFSAADAVFSKLVSDVANVQIGLGELPYRMVIAAAVAWVVAGLLVGVVRRAFRPEPVSLGAAASAQPLSGYRLGDVEAVVLLVAVDLVFAVFVVLQIGYLFGGADTLAISGMTYSDYARRGFFELIAVGFLSGALLVGMEIAGVRRTKAYVASAIGLAVLTLVVLASATVRLKVYQDAYGWTELRFYAYSAIAWLGLATVGVAGLLQRGQTRWLAHVLGLLVLVVALGVNVVGPQAYVAAQNVARSADPTLVAPGGETTLDVPYLVSLGDDAVPAMIEAVPLVPPIDRAILQGELRSRSYQLVQPEVTPWPAWNLARSRASEALAAAGYAK